MKSNKSPFWFWARVLLVTYPVKRKKPNLRCSVWKNVVLVCGLNEQEAYKNAYRLGMNSQSKPGDRLTMNGRPAETKFLGIADMGVIHDPLENGCEIFYERSRSALNVAKRAVSTRKRILKSLALELGPYKRNKWNPHSKKGQP